MQGSALGFGCSAVMGRVGRKASLASLGAAYDAGITLYDTARSYGYGESEGLLGEFLRGRRDSVIVSTKFGIEAAPTNMLKRAAKPIARRLIRALPGVRGAMRSQIAAQFSEGHFSVQSMRESVETSLRQLQTGYVDLLFLHLPPASVLDQDDLFAALEQLTVQGKVLRVGLAGDVPLAVLALERDLPMLRTVQAPCNLFDLTLADRMAGCAEDVVAIANHPFGGPSRITEGKALLRSMSQATDTPPALREKLHVVDDATLADLTLNLITKGTGIGFVVPSMLKLEHLRTNVAAMEHSRFAAEELAWVRHRLRAKA
jgi:aryl-alcohol dehydrogenase-like predicted oxidoreductase